jgi:uncharacterized protein (TIGR02996 family)
MEREADFLAALEAAPVDDTAWLAYADWLEERGDARGEYVRLTVALGRGEVEPERVVKVADRLSALAQQAADHWLKRCVQLRAEQPMQFRITEVQVEVYAAPVGDPRVRTLLHGVLEAGAIRCGDGVALPLADGGVLQDCVRRLRAGTQEFRRVCAGEEPRRFALVWAGRWPGIANFGAVRACEGAQAVVAKKLNRSLAELALSIRATNCLESEGITTVRDLVNRTDEELLAVRNFGETTLREVQDRLEAIGLELGMTLWPR